MRPIHVVQPDRFLHSTVQRSHVLHPLEKSEIFPGGPKTPFHRQRVFRHPHPVGACHPEAPQQVGSKLPPPAWSAPGTAGIAPADPPPEEAHTACLNPSKFPEGICSGKDSAATLQEVSSRPSGDRPLRNSTGISQGILSESLCGFPVKSAWGIFGVPTAFS